MSDEHFKDSWSVMKGPTTCSSTVKVGNRRTSRAWCAIRVRPVGALLHFSTRREIFFSRTVADLVFCNPTHGRSSAMSNLSDNMETSADSMKLRMIREIENHFGVSISTVLGSDLEAEDISRLPDQLVNALDQLIRAYNPSFDLFRASLNKCFQDRDRPPIPTKEDIFIIHRIFFVGTTNSESYSAALAVTRNWTPPYVFLTSSLRTTNTNPSAATHQEPYIPPQSTASASEVSQSNSIASASAPP